MASQIGNVVINPDGSLVGMGAITGNVASGVVDSGNPVKVGGKYNASAPTLADGQRGDLQFDVNGNVLTASKPSTYAVDDSAMPATPSIMPVGGEYRASATTYTDGDATVLQSDVNGNVKSTLGTAIAGEDITNDVLKVEQRFSYSNISADSLVTSGAGFLHTLTFAQIDAAPTAGTIIVYDNTAESGTIIYSETFDTTVFRGYTVTIDASFSVGLYVGFTTTADVGVTMSYR